ncbi:S-adenosyl-L-methionine-dependent methyltransferase [Trametes cingulata]|nr:S-adenosyl-L-methionine-dependent methyltransferase [Trametes cingulata]
MVSPTRAVPSLLAHLSRAIGRESAQNELRWMRQALDDPPDGIRPPVKTLEEMVARRVRGEPLQYILGSQPFGPLNLIVRPPVLIPRPETEDWALRLADTLKHTASPSRTLKILDLCTGTGCIPLLLCRILAPGSAHALGVDISEDAVRLAEDNAKLCGFDVPALQASASDPAPSERQRNTFTPVLADLMHRDFVAQARLQPPYDVITSNPPYIPKAQYAHLPRCVREYEDPRALLGDPEPAPEQIQKGLSFYHRIAQLVKEHALLREGGTLALEVGEGQAGEVAEIVLREAGLRDVEVWRDPWDKERVVVARP